MPSDTLVSLRANAPQRGPRLALFAVWLAIVLILAWHHAFWRDEVRAYSIALQGDDVVGMLKALHGEGHPAVWYLMLRTAHAVFHTPLVLPAVSLLTATAAVLLLALRSPFRLWVLGLVLFGGVGLYEYVVVSRNYGISMLAMFLLAWLYPRYRDRGIALGLLLALLANTNAHSALLVAAFLLFWLLDAAIQHGLRWTPALRSFGLNAVVAVIGVGLCAATIYPTFNDAALVDHGAAFAPGRLLEAAALPASQFPELVTHHPWQLLKLLGLRNEASRAALAALMSLAMVGSTFGLLRRPAAFVAALAALLMFSLFFAVISPGAYRHEALWLMFLLSMYWIALRRDPARELAVPPRSKAPLKAASWAGAGLLAGLLALQLPDSALALVNLLPGRPPLSQSASFAAFIGKHPELAHATVIAEPDHFAEALPYYLPNPIYMLHEQVYRPYVKFTRAVRAETSLDDVLKAAEQVAASTRRPVVILMATALDPAAPAKSVREGYNWRFDTTPEQVRAFEAATRKLGHFGPAITDESYDAYVLDPAKTS